MGFDPKLMETLKPLGAVADDAVVLALKANKGSAPGAIPGVHDAVRPAANAQKNWNSLEAVDTAVEKANGVAGMLAFLPLPAMLASGVFGGLAGLVGLKGAQKVLQAPSKFLHEKTVGKLKIPVNILLMDGAFALMSAFGLYNVSRGFVKKRAELHEMCADIMGKKTSEISFNWVMNSPDAPEIVRKARTHIGKEHFTRGAIQAASLGINARGVMTPGGVGSPGLIANLAPQLADQATDAFMGHSIVELYKPLKEAHKAGQEIPPQAYVELLMAASSELQAKGVAGRKMAWKLADKYATQKLSPADVLRKIETKEISKDIEHELHNMQAEQPKDARTVASGMVDKMNGVKHRPVVGQHTEKLQQNSGEHTISPGIA